MEITTKTALIFSSASCLLLSVEALSHKKEINALKLELERKNNDKEKVSSR